MTWEPAASSEFGNFKLAELLSHGPHSAVYRADHPAFGRDVALKIVDGHPDDLSEAATAVGAVAHPGVVPVYGHGETDGRAWLAMRLITGVALRTWLTHTSPSPTDVASIVRQVASALDALHAAGLTHGDVKPENILVVTANGRPDRLRTYLIDPLPPDSSYLTLDYAAPERLAGAPATPFSDQYSLAATAYELVAGTVPFLGDTPEMTAAAHMLSRPAPLGNSGRVSDRVLAIALDVVLRTSLSADPHDRYASCSGLATAFDSAAEAALECGAAALESPTIPPFGASRTTTWPPVFHPPDGGTVAPPDAFRPQWATATGADLRRAGNEPEGQRVLPAPAGPSMEQILEHIRATTPAHVARVNRTETADDDVDCSVFAPREFSPGSSALVQVFVHLAEDAEETSRTAVEFDERAERRAVHTLQVPIARGDVLTVDLRLRAIDVPEPVQQLRWLGRPTAVQFEAVVPEDLPVGHSTVGTVTLCRQGVAIGCLRFTIRIGADTAGTVHEIVGDAAMRFKRAFVSYASADRAAVLARVQVLRAASIEYFQDVDLDPGQRWERELYRQIESCDLFLLFWSQAAKDSTWVRKEVEYALELGDRKPEIRPVVIEGPPVPPPWDELADLHFSDRLLALLAAATQGSQAL